MRGYSPHAGTYRLMLQEAGGIYDALLALYQPDMQTEQDFAARTVLATTAQRAGIAGRLARPHEVSSASTASLIQSIGHYLDGHWDDYREIPAADPAKFAHRAQLHAALEEVISKLGALQNKLKP